LVYSSLKLIYRIIIIVPVIIHPAPIAVFRVKVSPRKMMEKTIANATLSLSIGATCDTLPSCKALK